MGPGVQKNPPATLPEGLPVLAPGHRPGGPRPGGDRRDHQAALRQVVPPEQRLAGDRRRVRPGPGVGEGKNPVRPDPEGRAPAPQAADLLQGPGRPGPQGVPVQVRRAPGADRVQHDPGRRPGRPGAGRDPERARGRPDLPAVPQAGGTGADRVGRVGGELHRPVSGVVRGECRAAQGQGPQEGRGVVVRRDRETGPRADLRRGVQPRPAEDSGRVRVLPGERPQPRRRDRPRQHLPRRRRCGEVLRRLPEPTRGDHEGRRSAGGERVPRPQRGHGRLVGAEGSGGEEGRRPARIWASGGLGSPGNRTPRSTPPVAAGSPSRPPSGWSSRTGSPSSRSKTTDCRSSWRGSR